jgi:hypothetical protein
MIGKDHDTIARVNDFLNAETHYKLAPIPAPIDVPTALPICLQHISPAKGPKTLAKLAGLTVLHDMTATAKSWMLVIERPTEVEAKDYDRSAQAVIALSWLGDDEQRSHAASYYTGMLARADPNTAQRPLSQACWAISPADRARGLRRWAEAEIDRLKADRARPSPARTPAQTRHIETRIDMVSQFANLEAARLDREFNLRRAADALPPIERAKHLVDIYCEVEPSGSAEIVWWAAMSLARVPKADPDRLVVVSERFMSVARAHEGDFAERQPEFDGTRAKALRGAIYFGAQPTEQEHVWLSEQADAGLDILVLRPDWKYDVPEQPRKQ